MSTFDCNRQPCQIPVKRFLIVRLYFTYKKSFKIISLFVFTNKIALPVTRLTLEINTCVLIADVYLCTKDRNLSRSYPEVNKKVKPM